MAVIVGAGVRAGAAAAARAAFAKHQPGTHSITIKGDDLKKLPDILELNPDITQMLAEKVAQDLEAQALLDATPDYLKVDQQVTDYAASYKEITVAEAMKMVAELKDKAAQKKALYGKPAWDNFNKQPGLAPPESVAPVAHIFVGGPANRQVKVIGPKQLKYSTKHLEKVSLYDIVDASKPLPVKTATYRQEIVHVSYHDDKKFYLMVHEDLTLEEAVAMVLTDFTRHSECRRS